MNKKFITTLVAILFLTMGTVMAEEKQPNEPDFAPYMRNMQKTIKAKWEPPKGDTSKRVVLFYTLNRKGEVIKSNILETSGDVNMDKAAMDALQEAAPFGKLPKSFKGQSIDVQFTFDYNVFGLGTQKNHYKNKGVL